jgi:hypothetical protein
VRMHLMSITELLTSNVGWSAGRRAGAALWKLQDEEVKIWSLSGLNMLAPAQRTAGRCSECPQLLNVLRR